MAYRFTGFTSRTYTQYTDLATGLPLSASPDLCYDMAPVGPFPLPVPPADGNWEAPRARQAKAAPQAPALKAPDAGTATAPGTGASTREET